MTRKYHFAGVMAIVLWRESGGGSRGDTRVAPIPRNED
jgi:hypothetical protein